MTDPDLIAKQLAFVETMVADLRRLAAPEHIASDIREERFVSHTLQMAAQAALDVASHIVSDERLGEPQTNREMFVLLERAGWLSASLSAQMQAMARTLGNAQALRDVVSYVRSLGAPSGAATAIEDRPNRAPTTTPKLSSRCPPSFDQRDGLCVFRSLYELYALPAGHGGLRAPLPLCLRFTGQFSTGRTTGKHYHKSDV